MGLSPVELAIVALVVVLLFGVKRLPELGSGMGQAISNFKRSYRDAASLDVTPKENLSGSTPSATVSNGGVGSAQFGNTAQSGNTAQVGNTQSGQIKP
jgi:sec-independent protein translocase protein TatA